jgi:Domain of unknown function (DUF6966)
MGPLTEKFILQLDALIELLEEDGDRHWSGWLRKSKKLIEQEDFRGVEYFLSAFGGMGSLNDYHCNASHSQTENFRKLKSSAFERAEEIKRSYESNT